MLGGKSGKFLTYNCDANHLDAAFMFGKGYKHEMMTMVSLQRTVIFLDTFSLC